MVLAANTSCLVGSGVGFGLLGPVAKLATIQSVQSTWLEGLIAFVPTYRMPESDPATGKAQGYTDDEPYGKNHQHRREWDGAAGALGPKEEIQKEKGGEYDSRYQ